MNSLKELEQKDIFSWICPDLTTYWQLSKIRDAQQFILKALEGNRCFRFSRPEGLGSTALHRTLYSRASPKPLLSETG
jgi:hypothetical protein